LKGITVKDPKLEKINDGLYIEHWKEGSRPFNWFKHSEHLWMTLHDIRLSAGVSVNDAREPQFARSIDAIGELERQWDIEVWEPEAGASHFSSVKVALRTDRHKAEEASAEPTSGVLIHVVGDILKYGPEREEPHLQFELYLPGAIMEQLWAEASNTLVAKATLSVKVEAFRSEMDRSLSEPWHPRTYCIENDSANTAMFERLWFEQSVVLPTPSADSEQ
jgi:hypothetical protein